MGERLRTLGPAVAAGMVSAAAFWWVTIGWLCPECDALGVCTWQPACVGWLGGVLGVVLIVLAFAIPFRLVEGRWPGRGA